MIRSSLRSLKFKILRRQFIKKKLIHLFARLYQFSYRRLSALATYNQFNSHEKQGFLKYHEFFVSNIEKSDRVLDVGSGLGQLSNSIQPYCKSITGVEIDELNVKKSRIKFPNITYYHEDIFNFNLKDINAVVMSNVYEHLKDRSRLLKSFKNSNVKKLLIRVPAFDRDWIVPFLDSYGIDYRLDETHEIEFTKDQLCSELITGGFKIRSLYAQWGEYYVVATI